MSPHLKLIQDQVQQNDKLSPEEKELLLKAVSDAAKEISITEFKLDRTEKVKKTTGILLEETIRELELKRKAVEESNAALQKSLEDLKAAQAQLIQSEKMASLGELTAGIAHEIQNPLNFVNNFSDVNAELIDELKSELAVIATQTATLREAKGEAGSGKQGNIQSAMELADNIKDNEQKINQHGRRADAIVKGMLQHSRTGSGQKESTDINVLADEYLRLAYHGYRAKEKSFNAKFETDFDPSIEMIHVIPQDIGRVLLNLINNAFYAVNEKQKRNIPGYDPAIKIATKNVNNKIEIRVEDNGIGIPQKVQDKIFQPFFTTKPTGSGTGLGLSISYDIVRTHGGAITASSKEGEGSEFIVRLPISQG
jgi:signal transduction histidine kinase